MPKFAPAFLGSMTFKNMRWRVFLLAICCLPAVSSADVFVRDDIITNPSSERFSVCHGNGCTLLSEASLNASQWARVAVSFHPPAASGAVEREQIRSAIAQIEHFAGAATDTSADRGRNARSKSSWEAEMDCIDESINTTLYLTMLTSKGLLRHHEVRGRATRGMLVFFWPHTTAVIRDKTDGSQWAVDSWFLDNGKPPYVVPLHLWRNGWEPGKEIASP